MQLWLNLTLPTAVAKLRPRTRGEYARTRICTERGKQCCKHGMEMLLSHSRTVSRPWRYNGPPTTYSILTLSVPWPPHSRPSITCRGVPRHCARLCRKALLRRRAFSLPAGSRPSSRRGAAEAGNPLYAEVVRLHACRKPVVGAIQGAAIGGGFGLALVPDFRVLCPETRFSANFVKLGFHPRLRAYLPPAAADRLATRHAALLYGPPDWRRGSLRVGPWEKSSPRSPTCGPLLWSWPGRSPRTRRSPCNPCGRPCAKDSSLGSRLPRRMSIREQHWLRRTQDHQEGLRAVAERRPGRFVGR